MANWSDEDHLRFSLEMALMKIKAKPRDDRDGIYRKIAAEQIIKHLLLSGWRFEHPKDGHRVG